MGDDLGENPLRVERSFGPSTRPAKRISFCRDLARAFSSSSRTMLARDVPDRRAVLSIQSARSSGIRIVNVLLTTAPNL